MSEQNQLEKLGNQFFKYRGQIPVLFFLVAFGLMHYFPMQENWLNACYTIVAIGLVVLGHLIRALAVGKRAAHTSGRNRDQQVAEALNSTGIYSMVRHPLYLGNITTYIGWAVFTGIDWLVPVFLILFVAYYRLIIVFYKSCFGKRIFWLGSVNDHCFCIGLVSKLCNGVAANQPKQSCGHGLVYSDLWFWHALPQKENPRFQGRLTLQKHYC